MKATFVKRALSLLLTAALFLTLAPTGVLAGNDGYIAVINIAELASEAKTAAYLYSNGSAGSAYNGASYDSASNTLTLNGFQNAGQYLEINNMGDDFRIEVKGSNIVGIIEVFGAGESGSLTITGDGSLNVNPDGSATMYYGYYSGIYLQAEGGNAVLTVDNGPDVTVRGYDGRQAVTVAGSRSANGIVISGSASGAEVHTEQQIQWISVKNEGDQWDSSLMLYTYNNAYYGVSQVSSYSSTTGETTVSYAIYTLTGNPTDGFTAFTPIAGEDSLAAIPAQYAPVYGNTYDHTLADANGTPLSYVSITSSTQAATQPTITTDALANAYGGVAYSAALTAVPANGGTITWSVVSGVLPAGLSLSDGTISGTPAATGSYSFTLRASEAGGGAISKQFTITVTAPTISTSFLPAAVDGAAYSAALKAVPANKGTITWSIVSGTLPAGLFLSNDGTISGTTSAKGDHTITVAATEEGGGIASKEFTLTVAEAVTVTYKLNGGMAAAGDTNDYTDTGNRVAKGGTITLPDAPTREAKDGNGDYIFAGWKAESYTYESRYPYIVSGDIIFTAQWERPLSVRYNGQVVGWTYLYGVSDSGQSCLWSGTYETAQSFPGITVDPWSLRDQQFNRLELRGTLDGDYNAVIAKLDDSFDQTTGSVTLGAAVTDGYTVLKGVTVDGLTEGMDYTVAEVKQGESTIYSFPRLVSNNKTYSVKLNGVKSSERFADYLWNETLSATIDADGYLTVTPMRVSEAVTVSGQVKVNNRPAYDTTVTATQNVGGVYRSVSAEAKWDDTKSACVYSLPLIPGYDATFSAVYNRQQLSITSGETLAGTSVTDGASHNLETITNSLTVTVTPDSSGMSDAEKAIAERYLRKIVSGSYSDRITDSSNNTTYYTSYAAPYAGSGGSSGTLRIDYYGATRLNSIYISGLSGGKSSIDLNYITNNNFSGIPVRLSVPGLMAENKSVDLVNGVAPAAFTPALMPGAVVRLNTQGTSGNFFFAWFDANGTWLGSTNTFYVGTSAADYAVTSPTGAAGSFKLALFPKSFQAAVAGASLNGLSTGAAAVWNVTLTAGRATDLGETQLSAAVSANAAYVTQPNSAFFADRESFSDEQELVTFSGHVGLDDGVTGGKLNSLYLDVHNSFHWEAVSAAAKALVINGNTYLPNGGGSQATGKYTFSFNEPVALPCDFTLYAVPGGVAWDMEVAVKADVTYDGGGDSYQLIGQATVERPGASIYTLSAYVCEEMVTLEGTARKNESVTLYDNEVVIGTATADKNGEWTARVPLSGIDDTFTTPHILYAVTDSGVTTDELLVFHQSGGVQLKRFTMTYRSAFAYRETVDVGDAIILPNGGSSYYKFTAAFEHPEQLGTLDGDPKAAAAAGTKVLFRIYTQDGQIRVVEGEDKGGGIYEAEFPSGLPSPVTRAEAAFRPASFSSGFGADGNNFTGDAGFSEELDAAIAEMLEAYSTSMAALKSDAEAKTANDSWTVELNEDGPSATGRNLTDDQKTQLTGITSALEGQDVALKSMHADYDTTETLLEWLNRIGEEYVTAASGKTAIYTDSRIFATAEDYQNAIENVKAYTNSETSQMHTGSYTFDTFFLTDTAWSEDTDGDDLSELSGSYVIEIMFSADSENNLYTAASVVMLSPNFQGYTGSAVTVSPYEDAAFSGAAGGVRLLSSRKQNNGVRLLSSGDPLGDGYYYKGKFRENATESAGNMLESGSGDIANWAGIISSICTSFPMLEGILTGVAIPASFFGNAMNFTMTMVRIRNLERMQSDLNRLLQTPCFQKLDPIDKNLCRDYVRIFEEVDIPRAKQWMWGATLLGCGTSILGVVCVCFPEFAPLVAIGGAIVNYKASKEATHWYEHCIDDYELYFNSWIAPMIYRMAAEYNDPNCINKEKDEERAKTSARNVPNVHDPSGIIYEGVLENPVEGATATLYYAADTGGALMKRTENATSVSGVASLKLADGVTGLTPESPVQTTGKDGLFQWFVPEGLWYVTASLGGLSGSSDADAAAIAVDGTPTLNGNNVTKLLPVLPPQLNVNIPLEDKTAPCVTDVRFTTDGVYVTFSKYMTEGGGTESVLSSGNYEVYAVGNSTTPLPITVTSVEQGHTPDNRGTSVSYTRTVLLSPASAWAEGTELNLRIRDTVKSYADTPMGEGRGYSGKTKAKAALAQPTISGTNSAGTAFSGTSVKAIMNRGDGLTLAAPVADAAVYYTTDGSMPEVRNGTPQGTTQRYSDPIPVYASMTVRAITVRSGYADSPESTASITLRGDMTTADNQPVAQSEPASPETPELPAPSGGSGGGGGAAATVSQGTMTNGTVKISSRSAAAGAKVTLTPTPNSGYKLDILTVKDKNGNTVELTKNADGTYTFTMPAKNLQPVKVEASFVKDGDAPAASFTDVPAEAFFAAAVKWAVEQGITNGVDSAHFAPDASCTRAQMVTFLWRAAGSPEPAGSALFTDVAGGSYYEKAVAWAVEQGITNGTGEGTFSPDDIVTRAQVVTFLYRYEKAEAGTESGFADVAEDAWFASAVTWAVEQGITNGTGDGQFSPANDCTRGQIVTFLWRDMVK